MNPRGIVYRAKDRVPLVGRDLVRELNRLHAQAQQLKHEVITTVGGLTPDPEALRDLEDAAEDEPAKIVRKKR